MRELQQSTRMNRRFSTYSLHWLCFFLFLFFYFSSVRPSRTNMLSCENMVKMIWFALIYIRTSFEISVNREYFWFTTKPSWFFFTKILLIAFTLFSNLRVRFCVSVCGCVFVSVFVYVYVCLCVCVGRNVYLCKSSLFHFSLLFLHTKRVRIIIRERTQCLKIKKYFALNHPKRTTSY